MIKLLKNLFKIAKILSTDDSGDLRFSIVSGSGKEQKVLMFTPYGLMSNPPVGSLTCVWSQQGQESNGIGMADDPKNRPLKDLAEGEVGLGNYATGDSFVLDEDGNFVHLVSNNVFKLIGANETKIVTGKSVLDSTTFELNGNTDNLVTWADLSSILASYWTIYNGHSHVLAGALDNTVSFDITAAKALTLKTDG